MQRMSFIPGPDAREYIHEVKGRLIVDHGALIALADDFIMNCPSGPNSLLYQICLSALSRNDTIDIHFGLRDVGEGERKDEDGELVGHTWAIHNTVLENGEKRSKTLWDVGRDSPLQSLEVANRAFLQYQYALAQHQEVVVPPPPPLQLMRPPAIPRKDEEGRPPHISRALSPSNLYYKSGIQFYFVELCMSAPGRPDYFSSDGTWAPSQLSRPMRSYEALQLAAVLTAAIGAPPLVFAVRQSIPKSLGKMPVGYLQRGYEVPDGWDDAEQDKIVLVC
jgi:hypothetical protein